MLFQKAVHDSFVVALFTLLTPAVTSAQPGTTPQQPPAPAKQPAPVKPPATTTGGKDGPFWTMSYGGTPIGAFYKSAEAPPLNQVFAARYYPETSRAILVEKSGRVTLWRVQNKKAAREKVAFQPPIKAVTRKAIFTRRDDLVYLLVDDVRVMDLLRKKPQEQQFPDRDYRVELSKDAHDWNAFPIPGQPETPLNGTYRVADKTINIELAEVANAPLRKVSLTLPEGLAKPFRSGPGDPLAEALFYFPGKGFVVRTPKGWAIADTNGAIRQSFDAQAIPASWWSNPTEKDGQFFVIARTGANGDTYRLDLGTKALVRVPPTAVATKPTTPPTPGTNPGVKDPSPSLLSAYDHRPFPVVELESGYPGPNDVEAIRLVGVWRNDRYFNLWVSRNRDNSLVAAAPRSNVLPGFVGEYAPMYRFVGSEWDQDENAKKARTEITRAFGAWSEIKAGKSVFNAAPLETSLRFAEYHPPLSVTIIDVAWDKRGPDGPIGQTDRSGINASGAVGQIRMWFNADVKWWFGKSDETPMDAYHFYSTALHEVGHVCGLSESYKTTTVMIFTRKRGPKGPCFEAIDDEARQVICRTYSRPAPATSPIPTPSPAPTAPPQPVTFPLKDLSLLSVYGAGPIPEL